MISSLMCASCRSARRDHHWTLAFFLFVTILLVLVAVFMGDHIGIDALFHCTSLKSATQSPSGMAVQCGLSRSTCWSTGTDFHLVHGAGHLDVLKRPWPRKGSRGMAIACGGRRRPYLAVHQTLSLVPSTVTVSGAGGHNRGGVAETPLLARTQGSTTDCTFNFPPPRTVAGCFFWCLLCLLMLLRQTQSEAPGFRGAPSKGNEAQPSVRGRKW